jgi:ABC-type amino acid transport substrate-binding protein
MAPWVVTDVPIYTGVEVDLARATVRKLAKRYNVNLAVEFKSYSVNNFFDDMVSKIQAKDCDVVMSAATVTAERSNVVDFSCPYFSTYLGLLRSGRNSTLQLTSVSSLDDKAVILGALRGTTSEMFIREAVSQPNILSYSSPNELWRAAENGTIHVAILDRSSVQYYLAYQSQGKCIGCYLVDVNIGTGDQFAMMTMKLK